MSLNGRILASLVDGRMDYARQLAAGTVDSGTTTTIVDAARTESEPGYWVGTWLYLRDPGGPPKGQVRLVTGFNPATDGAHRATRTSLLSAHGPRWSPSPAQWSPSPARW